jgi:hypothetical protein
MLTSEGSYPKTTVAGLETNMLWDGIFHAGHLGRSRGGDLPPLAQYNRSALSHPSNRGRVKPNYDAARSATGATVFDWLVEIIRDHGPGGDEAEDGVQLVLD